MELNTLPIVLESEARVELIKVLDSAGFIDGATLTPEELESIDVPIYWEDILDTNIAVNKPCYLVFTIQNPSPNIFADNKPVMTTINIDLDLFTTNDIASKNIQDIRQSLETKLAESIEFDYMELLSKAYDSNIKLNHISYRVKRVVAFGGKN